MALSKIQSESVNLADDFAFTGTITGAGGGKVLQFKQFTSSTAVNSSAGRIPYDDTIPTSSEGALVMSASFTPTSATSDVFILCNIFANEHTNAVSTIFIPLFAGTTHLQTGYVSARGGPGADGHSWGQCTFMAKHTPASTNAITYSVRGGLAGTSGTFESLATATSITNSKAGNTILNTMTIWEVE